MVDSVYRTRSLGVAAEGLPDQYADGKAAKVWEFYIGSKQERTQQYKQWINSVLRQNNCSTVLDVACGTGVDSIILLEEGFQVTSTDASDKMLKYALKERWNRRHEDIFDKWVIEEADWLSLSEDLEDIPSIPPEGFDAVICLGNSFAHLPDFAGGNKNQLRALNNFKSMVKPGGILLIDHRNYDHIIATGSVPMKNIYYNSKHITDVKCSNLYVNARPTLTTLDYVMDMSITEGEAMKRLKISPEDSTHHFRLSYYPHQLNEFSDLLRQVFGQDANHQVYADFKALNEVDNPAYYMHLIQRNS